LAAVLGLVAWGCSTDSPTAPRQTPPPPPGGPGTSFNISVDADPSGIVIPVVATGLESATVEVRVSNPTPADGTTIAVSTSIGSFSNSSFVPSVGLSLVNGRGFLTLFAGGLPIQFGVASVQATLQGRQGQTSVPISLLEADYVFSNPENNLSVIFTETSSGDPQEFLWDFGDGQTSSESDPLHVFPGPGAYQVTLTVTKTVAGVDLTDFVRKPVTISIIAP
jgi:PKD repeat protein